MSRRLTVGKFHIIQRYNPASKEFEYEAEAGPEGNVPVWNPADLPMYVVQAILALHTAPPEVLMTMPNDPKPKFDRNGWR